MKLSASILALSLASATAFAPAERLARKTTYLNTGMDNFDLSGNAWKPDSEKMGVSTS